MSQTTARTLAALELLQARQRVTGAVLAQRLQVDIRTARRYVSRLIGMGVPIASERGRDGAYRLTSSFKLPPMMFSDEEALALAVGLAAARDLGLGQARIAIDSSLIKLERVLPDALRARVQALGHAIRLDALKPGTVIHHETLGILSDAVQKRQRVRLSYQAETAAKAPTQRLFDAWGLAFYLGHWYVVGFCHLRGQARSFRLDRVRAVELVAASFAPPPQFDALTALRHGVATLPRRYATEVVMHATLDDARGELSAEMGIMQALPDAHSRTLLKSQVDDLNWFARELSRLPFRFEIRKPQALRTALARHVQQLRSR